MNIKKGYPENSVTKPATVYLKAFFRKASPVSITLISTILGVLPFLSKGPEEVFWFDFAIGTISGMIFSMVAIILVLPVFCVRSK